MMPAPEGLADIVAGLSDKPRSGGLRSFWLKSPRCRLTRICSKLRLPLILPDDAGAELLSRYPA